MRCSTSSGGIDLHLYVGDVRHGADGQPLIVEDAEHRHAQHGQQDQPAVLDRKADDAFEHEVYLSRVSGCARHWLCRART